MFKIIKAMWKVWRGKDINANEPVKVTARTQEEIDAYLEMMATEKKRATDNKEPWVGMLTMDVDYNNLDKGSFELDWNDYFVAQLMRAGYQGKVDSDLIDQWFTNICRNVVLETYEQSQADPSNRATDLGDGLREYK